MKITIEKEWNGVTIKDFIRLSLPGLSRRMLIELKKRQEGILLNGEHVTVRAVLHEGDVLTLAYEDSEDGEVIPMDLPLSILYEDEDLIALNKPPCMPTHPSHGHFTDSLANAVAGYYRRQSRPFVVRLINRLDGVTSGVVLVAKTPLSAARMSADLMAGRYEKRYLALVEGRVEQEEGRVERPIKRALPSIIMRTVCEDHEGEYALTEYRTLVSYPERTLLECAPITGRTHQIRVHMAFLGHPVAGDHLYGESLPELAGQIALHCSAMSFPHPSTREILTIQAPLSPSFAQLIETEEARLRENYHAPTPSDHS